jgi:hypothetical protein
MKIYRDIDILLATKHKKEEAIKQPFEKAFAARIHVPEDYDTDQFGTFTAEIHRKDTPYATVIKKAKEAALKYEFDYAIANEGSFGPHPTIGFAPGDIEMMSFLDLKNEITIVESEVTTETNYSHLEITKDKEYEGYIQRVKFPSHGLIIKSLDNDEIIEKGITNLDKLRGIINVSFKKYKTLRLETDMRAMMNPTRMSVIQKLAFKLIDRLQKQCKKCKAPGFGELSVKGNLLCEYCNTKTELYQYRVLSCVKCDYQEEWPRTDGLRKANQSQCPFCNP